MSTMSGYPAPPPQGPFRRPPTLREFCREKPVVAAGAFVTAGVLFAGLFSLTMGYSSRTQQILMRARVVAQAFTICAASGTPCLYLT